MRNSHGMEVIMADVRELRTERTRPRDDHGRKRRKTVALGAGILCVAAIGLCILVFFIVRSATGYVSDFVGLNETATYFDSYLDPVVMFDPDTFSDISKANPQWEIETAIWAALDTNEKSGSYASTADGREILPIKDIASYLKKYFGSAVQPSYETFTSGDFTYEYSKKERCYFIPLGAVTSYYIPKVTKISRGFRTVTLTVQYIPGENWGEDSSGNVTQPSPDKTMIIVLSGGNGSYVVKAIKNDEETQSITSSKSTSSRK